MAGLDLYFDAKMNCGKVGCRLRLQCDILKRVLSDKDVGKKYFNVVQAIFDAPATTLILRYSLRNVSHTFLNRSLSKLLARRMLI